MNDLLAIVVAVAWTLAVVLAPFALLMLANRARDRWYRRRAR